MISVAIHGAGQLAQGVARILATRGDVALIGPVRRSADALCSGADVVIIATTSLLRDVADDIEIAIGAGSNVIVSAEEAAYPWAADAAIAQRLDDFALEQGVTVLGCGLNPGFLFDALVLTLLGAYSRPVHIEIQRVVDLSGFGRAVRDRLGLGYDPSSFRAGRDAGRILGHAGFAQSMRLVADAIGRPVTWLDSDWEPTFAQRRLPVGEGWIDAGRTAGFRQVYIAHDGDDPWFTADFVGHVRLAELGLEPRDTIRITDARGTRSTVLDPGVAAQSGSSSMIANSIDRVLSAAPGWRTVAELPPARPTWVAA